MLAPSRGEMRQHQRRAALLALLVLGTSSLVAAGRLQPADVRLGRRRDEELANDRPIIGILTQPGDPAPRDHSYIAASYVKWIEAAGARVVPIMYDMTEAELRDRFDAINGLLLPGGGAPLRPGHPFYDAARVLFNLALDANDRGDYFPVHGTCLGLEVLSIIASGNTSVLSDMDAENYAAPLFYTDAAKGSRLLSSLPPHVVDHMAEHKAPIFENHGHGVLMTAYEENDKLKAFFKVLSLSLDKKGLPYISLMEARKYPVYASQFHPEKNAFEWASFLNIPHNFDAVEVTQEMANFFVSEARRNSHTPRDALQEQDLLIYNWPPTYTGRKESGREEQDFAQVYIFGPPRSVRQGAAGPVRAGLVPEQQRAASGSSPGCWLSRALAKLRWVRAQA